MYPKSSKLITGRNPFRKDEEILDYDMDSEEEYEELNGEDINSENTNEEEDEEMDEDETPGWIVPDGYLSEEEKKLGQEDEDNEEAAKARTAGAARPRLYETGSLKPKILLQQELSEELLQYTISLLPGRKFSRFPLKIMSIEEEEEENKNEHVLEEKYLKELVLKVHGSYDLKPKLIDEFVAEFPEIKKISVERKLKEIS